MRETLAFNGLNENMQLKVTSTRHFPGLFNPSLQKMKFTPKNATDYSILLQRGHSFSTYAKFSEKLTLLTP